MQSTEKTLRLPLPIAPQTPQALPLRMRAVLLPLLGKSSGELLAESSERRRDSVGLQLESEHRNTNDLRHKRELRLQQERSAHKTLSAYVCVCVCG